MTDGADDAALRDLLDRAAIREVLYRYCRRRTGATRN